MNLGETLFAALVSGGLMGAISTITLLGPNIRRVRADTKKVEMDTSVSAGGYTDARWQRMIEEQRESLIEPLKSEITRVREQNDEIIQANVDLRIKYMKAIVYIRQLNTWIAQHIHDGEAPPAMPAELLSDV